ncbi:MAG: polyphosphate kinase 1 [Ruminococcus flavefaciens]|nr:polyphosphate kinase 1 [Ruminococcus flavefaciens]MCM1360433.1 polyphosphate kinase 1 [Clostridiales bacterium]MCM1434527.1 polyphosphate kinase 1 [Ruminococcus flavefaciens]
MEYLENRELSWLKFNKRVLEEAVCEQNPLLERLSFSAIYQNNLDEFFMVRVGSLTDAAKTDKKKKDSRTNMTPAQQLDAVFTAVRRLQPSVEEAYRKTMGELSEFGFEHVSVENATKDELAFLELYFKREIKPFISGIVVNDALPFPFLKNKEIYAAVQLHAKKDVAIGIIPVNFENRDRMIPLGNGGKRFVLEEEVVLHFAHLMFKNYKVIDRALIRVTRNADIMVSGKGADFRDRMEELVANRKKLAPVRLEISDDFSRDALDYICKKLKIKNSRVFTSRIPLDLSYLFALQELDENPKLHYIQRSPQRPASISESKSIFSQVKAKDMLLSYPFESMSLSFVKLLQEAADDPKVTSIKITLYRLARNSKIIAALCTAAEHGKDVLVMIELRARFDEANNIEWSKVLQKSGVKVIYGPKDFKAHSKLLLITRKAQGGGYDYVTQIGTGNYNEKTSAIYTDLMLLTADRAIAEDAEAVFSGLLNGTFVEKTNKLLVSPLALRPQILAMMDEQIKIAQNGGNGYIAAKINSLCDKVIIEKLVEASQTGVKIDLVVRGICCIIPQVEGYTDNITVRSIVGRFLEHSRIFIFGKDGKEQKIYIGSADYMSRNTIRRVEVAAPVEDEKLKKRIREMFSVLMHDNVKARIMQNDGTYIRAERSENEEELNSQEYFYEEAYKKLADKKARQERMRVNRQKGAAKRTKKTSAKRKSKA